MSASHNDLATLPPTYGLLAQFPDEHALLVAAHRARQEGFYRMDAYSPFPVHGLSDVLGLPRSRVPLIVLCMGMIGGVAGLLFQYWVTAKAYPINVGGKPPASWPQYIPPAFETTILFAAFSALIGMLLINGLPLPYHPVFNVANFSKASTDGFFLLIQSTDPRFDPVGTRTFLESLHPIEINDVEH